jgi:hypothetical protein
MYTQTETSTSPHSETKQDMRLIRYVDALREAFELEMQRDPQVFLFGLVRPLVYRKNLGLTVSFVLHYQKMR